MPAKKSEKRKAKSVKTVKPAKKVLTGKANVQKKQAPETGGSLRVDVYDTKGKVVGKLGLPKEIFGTKVNGNLMAQAVRVYLANQRQGTQSTKTRGEVRGSTRKIYRQKGTGRARHGSIRAPIFVHGGIAFGPKPRDFSLSLSQNMRRKALFYALTTKLNDKAIQIVDGLETFPPKTKKMAELLQKMNEQTATTLLILPKDAQGAKKAARNIAGLDVTEANLLNAYTVLSHERLLFTKNAIELVSQTWIK